MLQLAKVHMFIEISWFVHNIWEIMRCVDHVRLGGLTNYYSRDINSSMFEFWCKL